jgi:hypothetical protein
MRKSRFTESQIVSILKQGESGVPIAEILRQHGISKATRAARRPVAEGHCPLAGARRGRAACPRAREHMLAEWPFRREQSAAQPWPQRRARRGVQLESASSPC